MLWIGYRTNQLNGAHMDLFSGIANPLGLKIGPNTTKDQFVDLIRLLNPNNLQGKLIVILRLGKNNVKLHLEVFIKAKILNNLHFIWMCDPMHGNTY